MRPNPSLSHRLSIAAAAALFAFPAPAAVVAGSELSVLVRIDDLEGRFFAPVLGDGSVRGSFALAACDGSVKPADTCVGAAADAVSLSFQASVFPFVAGVFSVTDFGAPSLFLASIGLPIPQIGGTADSLLEGQVTSSQSRNPGVLGSPLSSGDFIEGVASGPGGSATVATNGDGALSQSSNGPVSETYGPFADIFDCAMIGGCDFITLVLGVSGRGDGENYTLSGRFDLDPRPDAVIPLPATAALLVGGLGALGLLGRRRRA